MSRPALITGLALLLLAAPGRDVRAQMLAQDMPARQVTLFGILATPAAPGTATVDPKLSKIAPQLRKLYPDASYSFKLLNSKSTRLMPGQAVTTPLGGGFVSGAELLNVPDNDGNIQFRFALDLDGRTEFATIVKTPPNQLFFCDKALPNGQKLLIGLGGR